mmetsp:Transcript_122857/g.393575  ORF Transcript_122857/g.393575 Transcript_122857/m.393575 type:complete len:313 (-) Transcript_122857:60-998(-)|eukprot:CAMPEP_0203888382 /NCGR_PEP_ID=MMETSP0359-20131031/31994_1 /ASSEMBLY_ACC=CAM_ASM_000338 /TAXON_ID=268821 /ORGANISM="Scrippsiella Hangoei, Strain SHTV-5" /LENGTH=312 /DNA_ID=CAMNT_0050809569 /DNA_START=21 /DNA_END=959 /DNA_ORIENTATION=+
MALAASAVYPAVRRFLLAVALPRALKAFDKETGFDAPAPAKGKKAKALARLELTEACKLWLEGQLGGEQPLEASDVYPAARRFLLESGLQRALKLFDLETEFNEAAPVKGKKAKALARLELTEACQLWLDGQLGEAVAEGSPKKKKRKASEASEVAQEPPAKKKRKASEAVAVAEEEAAEEPPKKKRKASEVAAEAAEVEPAKATAKDKRKQEKEERKQERKAGVPFQRIDNDKWIKTIKDDRLMDNTHLAKIKFGAADGDSWGDQAAVDLLKVKGKGFRKEMAKKKRASWRGGGSIDQGVNSIKFSESEEE